MAEYKLIVPAGANDFQYGTDNGGQPITRSAGGIYETDNPCDAIAFYNAARTTNPNIGRKDESPDFWSTVDAACQAQIASAPPQPPTLPTSESNPANTGGDSGIQQGSPPSPSGGNLEGEGSSTASNGSDSIIPPTEEPTRPATGSQHPTHGGEQPQEQTNAGDPVDIFNGAFYLQETDFEIPNTVLPLSFTRFYKSGAASFGPFGWNWDHNFNLFLRELNTGDIALWRNLHEEIFKFDGAGFEPQRGVFEKLERIPALAQVYEIKGEGGVIMRFERPPGWIDGERMPLIWIKDRHGNQLRFSYGAEDKLAEVRDDDDRFFRFDYDQCGLLVSVTDNSGRRFQYDHDEETMQLVCVKSPAISDHPNGITRIYHYEKPWALPELRHNIIRVEDAQGNVYLENTYEQDPSSWSYARVKEQLYGGFLYQFQFTQLQWVPANPVYVNIPAVRVEVMNPDFGLETYTFNYRGDLLDRRYRLSKDKSYRVVVWQYAFDEQGNLSKTTRPDGSEEINVFDFANPDPRMRGKLLRKEITSASGFPSPSRIVWRGKYEPVYQLLIEGKNEIGATTIYKYDFNITPAALTNSGKLIELIQPDANLPDGTIQTAKTTFEYNTKGQPIATILPDGIRNELIYGVAGNEKSRLIKLVFDVGGLDAEEQIKYGLFGFSSEKVDRNGNSIKQLYNSLGLLEKTILPAINGVTAEQIIHYDSDRKVISSERPKGDFNDGLITGNHIIDEFERDVLGYPVKYKLSSNTGEQRSLMITNNYRGFPIETINPDGSKLRISYDERGLLLSEELIGIDSNKISNKKVYDRSGKLTQETNESGLTTKFEYDGFSRISKVFLPNGTEIRNKWLPNDLLESEETIGDDGTGTIRQLTLKSYSYDEKNRKVTETIKSFTSNPAVFTNINATFFYDNMNRAVKVISNRGGISTSQFDSLGRLSIEVDAMGNEEHYSYDNNGNLIQTSSRHKEPDSSVSVFTKRFEYDSRNRRIALIEPDGAKIISNYDDRNLLVSLTDQQGIVKEMFYDSFNNKVREIEDSGGLNITKQWTVDNMSRITSFFDPMGQVSKYAFDSIGRNIRVDYPNGFISSKVFNDKNQIVKEQLGSGTELAYSYDTSNRIKKIENSVFPSPLLKVDTHEFTYDGLDRVLSAKVGANIVQRKYDSRSRLLEETTHGKTISCTYDDATGEVEKIWPDGRTEKLSHDFNGVLTKIVETANGTLGSGNALLATFKPSGANFFGEAAYSSGISIKNSYDERKRLTTIAATSPGGLNESVHYRYNTSNLKQVEAISGQNPKLSFFEFDNKFRLLNASDSFVTPIPNALNQSEHDAAILTVKVSSAAATHQEKFLYNPSDARTKYSETALPDKNYTYQPGYRIQNDGTNAYNHYTDGTLSSDGPFTYEADALGRILKIKSGTSTIAEIIYDAFGRPSIVKELGKPDKSFNYLGGFIEQENESGIAARQITLHPVTGIPIAFHSASGTHYSLFDNRFNLIALLDDNGSLIESYRYKSFGQPQIFDNAGTPLSNSSIGIQPVFGGQIFLSESKLYLSKKRLMNPVNGSFLTLDPKGYVDSSSLYIYSGQDPINNIDPNGEIIPFIVAAFVIGGAVAGAGYSAYDAYHHPDKYEGLGGTARIIGNVFGGAAIGGLAIVGGELVLAAGGTGIFATGTGAAVTSLTASQSFLLYGTSSVVSGGILRGGFNSLFPEYVNPVTARSASIDFVAGGAIGTGLRAITNYVTTPGSGFGIWSSVPAGTGKFSQWFRFGADAGGEEVISGNLGAYSGRIGQWLDKIGIRQGYSSSVSNFDAGTGNIFGRIDTGIHEGFHALVSRYLPTFKNLSMSSRLGAIGRYPEEVVAYALGHGAAGRIHGIPFAPFEAINSLSGFTAAEIQAAKIFWSRLTGAAGVAAAEQLSFGASNHPNEKPSTSK
jgi:RHS repeat-associated protein